MHPLGVGIIGCGNISTAYLRLAPLFRGIVVRAVADIDPAAAERQAGAFDVRAEPVDALLAAADIDVVVNLTVPAAHYAVTTRILTAGKHAYSEKPFVLSVAEGEALRALAAEKGLRVGSAPDTILGGALQQARDLIDRGAIGAVTSGTAHVMSGGMEHWHPNPDFFFQPGAGPVLDVGPYYIAALIHLLGPVAEVVAISTTPSAHRTIGSGDRKGETVPVGTPTTIHSILSFASGAVVTLGASWDVRAHRHGHIELYGPEGTLFLPDPNFFGGQIEQADAGGSVTPVSAWNHPFGIPNEERPGVTQANYRTAGLADMAAAILADRPHRCALDFALHTVEVMTAILEAGERRAAVALTTTCSRPEPLSPAAAAALVRAPA